MKIFQIEHHRCHWDATPVHPTIEDTVGVYAPEVVFVEAPDYVFEGWGYDETQDGDERFVKPIAPEGWMYNDETGAFDKIEREIDIDSPDAPITDAQFADMLREAGLLEPEPAPEPEPEPEQTDPEQPENPEEPEQPGAEPEPEQPEMSEPTTEEEEIV